MDPLQLHSVERHLRLQALIFFYKDRETLEEFKIERYCEPTAVTNESKGLHSRTSRFTASPHAARIAPFPIFRSPASQAVQFNKK